jgi:hypothetical protein
VSGAGLRAERSKRRPQQCLQSAQGLLCHSAASLAQAPRRGAPSVPCRSRRAGGGGGVGGGRWRRSRCGRASRPPCGALARPSRSCSSPPSTCAARCPSRARAHATHHTPRTAHHTHTYEHANKRTNASAHTPAHTYTKHNHTTSPPPAAAASGCGDGGSYAKLAAAKTTTDTAPPTLRQYPGHRLPRVECRLSRVACLVSCVACRVPRAVCRATFSGAPHTTRGQRLPRGPLSSRSSAPANSGCSSGAPPTLSSACIGHPPGPILNLPPRPAPSRRCCCRRRRHQQQPDLARALSLFRRSDEVVARGLAADDLRAVFGPVEVLPCPP